MTNEAKFLNDLDTKVAQAVLRLTGTEKMPVLRWRRRNCAASDQGEAHQVRHAGDHR